MANRSYLATTDNDTIYPSAAESNYDPDAQTVAQGVYCVPLLWLGLFRPPDMRTQDFNIDGETVTGVARHAIHGRNNDRMQPLSEN